MDSSRISTFYLVSLYRAWGNDGVIFWEAESRGNSSHRIHPWWFVMRRTEGCGHDPIPVNQQGG